MPGFGMKTALVMVLVINFQQAESICVCGEARYLPQGKCSNDSATGVHCHRPSF
jgi:hypothetical protein